MSSKPSTPTTKPCNIPGIEYDHAFPESLQTNLSALAGVFDFPTTQELWDLTQKDPSTKPIFDVWAGERKNFPTNLRGLTHTKLMNLASNQAFHPILANDKHPAFSSQVFQQNQSQLPAQGKAEVNNMNLPHLTALWYITRLIREKPALFPGSSVSSVSQTTGEVIMSFDAYDVFHAWKLLKWIWWVKVPKTKPRVKRATPPVFHTDSTDSTAGDASGGLDGSSGTAVKVEDSKDIPDAKSVPADDATKSAQDTAKDAAEQDAQQGTDDQVSVGETHSQVDDASKDAAGPDASRGVESKNTAIDTPYETAAKEEAIPDTDITQIKTEYIEDTAKRGLPDGEDGVGESGVSKKIKTC
ncbi:hypothetical protein ASPVEDRAFT_78506 [Aspergillus versicolor CBS 583.65]|uniref:Uncharacterized protein n=1 Tax=Aspergillus versicolor CBS 583.65 TaxID=1036611 RepID=A0A1L9P5N3_ASPVE|nr:uncharacterized protein ASPVEDRAFT_78506 [Aspergillus versicolor CBS 583.65]OJI96754.1 hypothetical protein ASPVEDRAFT_78506 [Aspergillus versicolor CBS 583.65]